MIINYEKSSCRIGGWREDFIWTKEHHFHKKAYSLQCVMVTFPSRPYPYLYINVMPSEKYAPIIMQNSTPDFRTAAQGFPYPGVVFEAHV